MFIKIIKFKVNLFPDEPFFGWWNIVHQSFFSLINP